MTRESPDAERLTRALQLKGWQPARGDVEPLFGLVAAGDRDAAEAASRALARLGLDAARAAVARFDAAPPVARARLTRLVGRVAQAKHDPALIDFLVARIADADDKTARNAALALGKLGAERVAADVVERALLARWNSAPPALRRALAESLGKLGGADALDLLDRDRDDADDAELRRVTHEARVKIRRTLGRADAGAILDDVAPLAPLPLVAHCRHGLASLLADELGGKILDDETVALTLRAPLASLWRARTMLRFGFPLRAGGDDVESAVVAALASDAAFAIVSRFTRGPIRYRLEWSDAGHRRALTFRVAAAVAARRPALINDPTATLWEVIVRERGKRFSVELWPRGLPDPRFAYRVAHVPASSHPTLAAALVRVAGARPDDVVWDPFVGAATELVERARLGPARALIGSDADDDALVRARDNLAAARVDATLARADARTFTPPLPPTAIITNPPMGRRVLDRRQTGELFRDFLAHAAALLPRGGRLTWISPRGDETLAVATPLGLRATYRQRVDMAGFWAEIQSFTKR
ncbi:MAG TPA: HEAT repeat domain-containing protein [Polyangia bacterium]